MLYKFQKKFFIITFLFSHIFLYPFIDYSKYLNDTTDDSLIKEIFTIKIGIMNFKKIGKIQNINPVDMENLINTIKNTLDKLPAIKLNSKESIIKLLKIYSKKIEKNDSFRLERKRYFETKITFSDELDYNILAELYLEFKGHKLFSKIKRKWFEDIGNFYHVLQTVQPFERSVLSNEEICNEKDVDILISGEIERIDKLYYINMFFYSSLSKKKVYETTFVTGSETLEKNIEKELKVIFPKVFLINYATLYIKTNDENVMLFLNNEYIGRKDVIIEYLIPGNYVIKLKKENYEDKLLNVTLDSFEKKELTVEIDKIKKLQLVNFNIEPYGSKIFINSVYQGKTPFKKALPEGNYVISAKNEFYESYRYLLVIDEIKEEEKNIIFHLKSKDPLDYFKLKKTLYYIAFWNFTFSLATSVPLTVFANHAFYSYYSYANAFKGKTISEQEKIQLENMKIARDVLYAASWTSLSYTVLSLIWLFISLSDYIKVLEKRDFIPIIEFYNKTIDAKNPINEMTLGLNFKF